MENIAREILILKRKSELLTQQELADKAGVALRSLQGWEKNLNGIKLGNFFKICNALGLEITISEKEEA